MDTSAQHDNRDDAALVAAINGGEAQAFDVLYRRHRDWVLRLAMRFCGSEQDALDVTQDAFIYLLGKFPGFELRARLTTVLYPAVRHLSIDRVTRRRRMVLGDEAVQHASDASAVAQSVAAHHPGSAAMAHEDLRRLLDCLPQAQREVVLMRFVDDMALGEIAQALDIPVGTVKSRIHNALKTLREDPATQRYFAG